VLNELSSKDGFNRPAQHRLGLPGQSIRFYVVDEHVDIVTEDGELVGVIVLKPEKDYQPIIRTPKT
jgi:hypothetical protein